MEFTVLIDPDDYEEICQDSPFNLKKDYKKLKIKHIEEYNQLAKEIADEIIQNPNPPQRCLLYRKDHIDILKIRMADPNNKKGKSGGLRLIVLKDNKNKVALLLTIFSKKEKEDISSKEKSSVCLLANKYAAS